MMSVADWKPAKLNELGFVGRGKSRHRPRNAAFLYGGRYPFFQTGDIKAANFYLTEYSQTYSEEGLAQSKLWKPGTLCITIAANIAESAVLGIEGCFPDSVVGFVADSEKADVRFIKYYMEILKLQMQNVSHGATQDNLSVDKLLSFNFLVPPLSVQQRIAGILAAYDELIENNQRRIRILEDMARSLYREWFIHFRFPTENEPSPDATRHPLPSPLPLGEVGERVRSMGEGRGEGRVKLVDSPLGQIPQGWKVKKLGDIAVVNRAQINAKNAPDELHYIDIASVSPGQIDYATTYVFADAPGRARRVVQHGDVLWSCVRPNRRSHALVMHPEINTIASTGFAVLTAKAVPFTFLYFATTTDDFVSYLTNNASGAAYPAVTATTFEKAELLIPSPALLERFGEATIAMTEQAHTLQRQTANLRRTRDLLLPRLLSGQVALPVSASELDEVMP
jgi:type I restriction enzyme S subunit